MRRFLVILLFISIGVNAYFLVINLGRMHRSNEEKKLHFWKDISYQEGFDHFKKQMKEKYPLFPFEEKIYVVYRWDSTLFEFEYAEQMKVLDSLAGCLGKRTFCYVFATEMEQTASDSFLKRNNTKFENVKMLYNMDDYLSGLYSCKDVKLKKGKHFGASPEKMKEECGIDVTKFKKKTFFVIMDSKSKILFNNKNIFMVLKDTAFMNKLNSLAQEDKIKTIN
ncbi:MAG TPA: hypothetical protein VN026_07585 [Bacteroidia bacterium]|nr:hypothetical protein [Bacteroidia bacterium]